MVLKELILTVSTLGGCSGLERTDFNSFYFERVWQLLKELILTVSTLILIVSTLRVWQWFERTDFNSFYFGRVWQS